MRIITTSISILLLSGCAVNPVVSYDANGETIYTMDCNASMKQCHNKASEICNKTGYDVIEELSSTSSRVVHYGEHPEKTTTNSLSIKCR